MSYDLYFWPSGVAKNPGRLADRLAEEHVGRLRPNEQVLAFRADLLSRWPDLADMIAPWHHDLGGRRPWGRTDLADRYLMLTLPYRWEPMAALPALAGGYGLDCYDPQADQLIGPKPRPVGTVGAGADRVGGIQGWVGEDHVVQALQRISAYIGYRYDDLDEAALTGALDETNDETPDGWFTYPLQGIPPLLVHLAQSPGSAAVSVRVEGAIDTVLAARIETLLDGL